MHKGYGIIVFMSNFEDRAYIAIYAILRANCGGKPKALPPTAQSGSSDARGAKAEKSGKDSLS
jgi:hypothetical protein